jgi:hypothetical protein
MFMLTDKQVREVGCRRKVFQSRICLNTCSRGALSHAVESGIDEYIADWQEQGSLWVYNIREDVNAFADVIKFFGHHLCECCRL